jgi:hypothetical protein
MSMKTAASVYDERARLLCVYSAAASDHRRVVAFLKERSWITMKRDHDIRALAEKARTLAEQTRAALEKHAVEQGC